MDGERAQIATSPTETFESGQLQLTRRHLDLAAVSVVALELVVATRLHVHVVVSP